MTTQSEHYHLPTGEPEEPPICILCLKESDGLTESSSFHQNSRRRSKKHDYYVPLERFLGSQLFSSGFITSFQQTCPTCSLLLDKFTALYGTWRRMELELEWSIERIRDIIESADRVSSRIAFVKKRKRHDSEKGMEDESYLNQVVEWRRNLVRTCKRKLLGSFPKIKLCKCDEEANERHSHNEPFCHREMGVVVGRRSNKLPVTEEPDSSPTRSPDCCGLLNSQNGSSALTLLGQTESEPILRLVLKEEIENLVEPHLQEGLLVVSTPSNTVGNHVTEEGEFFASFSGPPPPECDEDDDYQSLGDELLMETSEDFTESSFSSAGAFQTDQYQSPHIASIVKKETVIGGIDDDGACTEKTITAPKLNEPPQPGGELTPGTIFKEEKLNVGGENEDLSNISRLRAKFRCHQCSSKTFSTKEKLDTHLETHADDDDDDEPEDNSDGVDPDSNLSSGSEYQNGEDSDESDLEISSEGEQDSEDIKDNPNGDKHHHKSSQSQDDPPPPPPSSTPGQPQPPLAPDKRHGDKIDNNGSLGTFAPMKPPAKKIIRTDRWCSICHLEFTSPNLYKRHYALHHELANVVHPEAVLRCTQGGCDAYYLLPFQLRDHLFRAHGVSLDNEKRTKFDCSVCQQSFTEAGTRRKHFARCHDLGKLQNPADDVLKCDQPPCTAYFLQARQLELHRGEFHGKWYECSNCGKEFRSRTELKKHRYATHKNELDLSFCCEVEGCDKKFESEKHLQWHTNWHKKNDFEPLSCPKCDKVLRGKDALKMHMFSHRERNARIKIKSWVCEQCGKVFKQKSRLAIHYKSHAGSDSWEFQCATCGKKCISKGKLEEHLRTHTGEKPYCCEHCGVYYAHKHNLRIHVNRKHPEAVSKEGSYN